VLSTIHSAKGQEWDAVFILNVVDGCIPSDMATGISDQIGEERHLLYVAMTRAKQHLHLVQPLRFFSLTSAGMVMGTCSRRRPGSSQIPFWSFSSAVPGRKAPTPSRRHFQRPLASTSPNACATRGGNLMATIRLPPSAYRPEPDLGRGRAALPRCADFVAKVPCCDRRAVIPSL
jgi:UvrD-like helicase C-terminal domain